MAAPFTPDQPFKDINVINESERSVDPADDEGKLVQLEADGQFSDKFFRRYDNLTPFVTAGDEVFVAPGHIYDGGDLYEFRADSPKPFSAPTAPTTDPRIDLVSFGRPVMLQTQHNSNTGFVDKTDLREGQIFTMGVQDQIIAAYPEIGLFNLTSVTLRGNRQFNTGTPKNSLVVAFWEVDVDVPSTFMGQIVIGDFSFGRTDNDPTGSNVTVDFSALDIKFEWGKKYAIVMSKLADSANNSRYRFQNTNVYSGGNRIRSTDGGSTWVQETSNDLYFVITGRAPGAGMIQISSGIEAASPAVPTLPTGHTPIAQIYNRNGQTKITPVDNGTEGYITDVRKLISL